MPTLPTAVIGEAFRRTPSWEVLEELTAIGNRMAGQPGEREGARVMREAFDRVGLRDVAATEFDIEAWWRGSSALSVDAPHERTFDRDHELIALPGTPSCDLEAEVVDVGYGVPEDFDGIDVDGRMVLAASWVPDDYGRWVHRQEKYGAAVDGGAVGFLFSNHEPGGRPASGFVRFAGAPAPIPAAGVSAELGARLRRYADDGVSASLSIDCRHDERTSRNVEGVVGPTTDDEIVVGAHVDAHDVGEGAGDDGCGSALLVEVARLLVAAESELETRVRFVSFGAEEPGMYGSDHWIDTHDVDAVRCAINLDGIGDSRTPRVYHHGFEALRTAVDAAGADLDIRLEHDPAILPHGDQWPFVRRGVVAGMIGSGDAGRVANAHTHTDTLDKIDRRDIRDLAIAIATAVIKLADRDRELSPVTPARIVDRMDEGTKVGLVRQARWEFEGVDPPVDSVV